MKLLAGDIGGTKTLLCVAEVRGKQVRILHRQRYASRSYGQFSELLRQYLESVAEHRGEIEGLGLAVAGPVRGQRARITHLPWLIDAAALQREFALARVSLVNDFAGVAHGIAAMAPDELLVLQPGETEPQGTRAVIGAGTGLGEALMVWCDGRYRILPTEAGHSDFAPADALQAGLWRYIGERSARVTWDQVLSGRGLESMYRYLVERSGEPVGPALGALPEGADPAAAISGGALTNCDARAVEALDLFARVYGSHAGNTALSAMATGGIYIAGGIAPRIADKLADGAFMEGFRDKAPMADLVRRIPVTLVKNSEVGVYGAALAAAGD